MYINFHYFAVKTVCMEAGFSEKDSQIIASYSQFVDDYDIWRDYLFEDVPDYAKHLVIDKKSSYYKFYTVTTGFKRLLDDARLSIPKYQREIVVPFHFIPVKRLSDFPNDIDRSEYRTVEASLETHFLINELLEDARLRYIKENNVYNLIRIGILIHIFADTFAHQHFSGFHGWENFSYLKKVSDNFDFDKDITKKYHPNIYHDLYSIGHARVYSSPDASFASFEIVMAENENQKKKYEYTLNYKRNNTELFLKASKQILNYLLKCKQKETVSESRWEGIKNNLIRGFAAHSNKPDELSKWWNKISPDFNYHYDKNELWSSMLIKSEKKLTETELADIKSHNMRSEKGIFEDRYKTAKDEFFYYNILAYEIRQSVIGNNKERV